MLSEVVISSNNRHLLKEFIANIGEAGKSFRYFNSRPIEVIDHHVATLLLMLDSIPVCYGHLDRDSNIVWLGICVRPGYAGKGIGNMMMNSLVNKAKENGLNEIFLTVDQSNLAAISLYEKFGFKLVSSGETYFKYRLEIDKA